MRHRFELWCTGGHIELVALWRREVRLTSDQKRMRSIDPSAAVKEAMRLIEDNPLSKAMVHLTGNGLGDLSL